MTDIQTKLALDTIETEDYKAFVEKFKPKKEMKKTCFNSHFFTIKDMLAITRDATGDFFLTKEESCLSTSRNSIKCYIKEAEKKRETYGLAE